MVPQTPTSGPVKIAVATHRGDPGKRFRDNRHIAVATRVSRVSRERARSPSGDVPMLNCGGVDFDDTDFGPEEE